MVIRLGAFSRSCRRCRDKTSIPSSLRPLSLLRAAARNEGDSEDTLSSLGPATADADAALTRLPPLPDGTGDDESGRVLGESFARWRCPSRASLIVRSGLVQLVL